MRAVTSPPCRMKAVLLYDALQALERRLSPVGPPD